MALELLHLPLCASQATVLGSAGVEVPVTRGMTRKIPTAVQVPAAARAVWTPLPEDQQEEKGITVSIEVTDQQEEAVSTQRGQEIIYLEPR